MFERLKYALEPWSLFHLTWRAKYSWRRWRDYEQDMAEKEARRQRSEADKRSQAERTAAIANAREAAIQRIPEPYRAAVRTYLKHPSVSVAEDAMTGIMALPDVRDQIRVMKVICNNNSVAVQSKGAQKWATNVSKLIIELTKTGEFGEL